MYSLLLIIKAVPLTEMDTFLDLFVFSVKDVVCLSVCLFVCLSVCLIFLTFGAHIGLGPKKKSLHFDTDLGLDCPLHLLK